MLRRRREASSSSRGSFVPRGELQKFLEVVDRNVRWPDLGFLLVGPRGCGKSALIEHAIHDAFIDLALRRQVDYVGVLIRPRDGYVAEVVTKEIRKGRDTRVETIRGGTSGGLYKLLQSHLNKRLAKHKEAFVVFAIDDLDVSFDEDYTPTILYRLQDWARDVRLLYGLTSTAVAPLSSIVYLKLDKMRKIPSSFMTLYMLGYSPNEFSNLLFPHVVKDVEEWKRRGGPDPHEAWYLTGGLPAMFEKLYMEVMSPAGFQKSRFIDFLVANYGIAALQHKLIRRKLVGMLMDVIKNINLLSEVEYVELAQLLAETEAVVRVNPIGILSTDMPPEMVGEFYAWTAPIIRDLINENIVAPHSIRLKRPR